MRCRQARQKLTSLFSNSLAEQEAQALREHLRQCPGCARLAQEERLLSADLELLRHVQPSRAMSIDRVREGIAIRQEHDTNKNLGARIMRQASETIYRRPRLSMAVAVSFVLLMASVLVPVVPDHAIGYEVAFAAPADGLILHEQNARKMLAALNMDDARVVVVESDKGTEYRITPLTDTVQVRRLMEILDSLGGSEKRRVEATDHTEGKRTVWELLLDREPGDKPSSSKDPSKVFISLDDVDGLPQDDFVLWIPTERGQDDSLAGIVIDREGDETKIWMPGLRPAPDDRGWNPWLNGNTVMKTVGPDGDSVEYDFTNIDDVRKLEKMGYNFWLMEFDTPGQIPIPDMGPKLNEIKPNPFADQTIIECMVPQAYEIQLKILDERGRIIRILQDCIVIAGIYQVIWDGLDHGGSPVEPGTYLCRFTAGDYVQTEKIVLLK
ncbi:MAG: zf-HC2 domain-containing protein [Candidatus Zixiibacteriota bacterium]|nr:MAG: zf-HC2 domain-containing protein [candidate division Zixibacteria bacterium]